ncbi:MAG: molybdate ABC transporter substrate-binding protein [Verrucomicrobia bacterium]|nr:molybdate ABC transporter substrate-binding protein [Verrucomicrobiota bacterium]
MNSAAKTFVVSILAIVLLIALLVWNPSDQATSWGGEPIVMFCAAGIKPPVEEVAREYSDLFGIPVQLQYGGSGTLLSNVRVAGRGDLFLAADASYLEIAKSNHVVAEVIPLATMIPVIAVPKGNPKNIHGVRDLLRTEIAVALANPDAAAIGKITRRLLTQSGIWDDLEKHAKVFKPTVNDVANDIKLGTVDAAVIWDSTVNQYAELEGIQVPELSSGTQKVSVGVLASSKQPAAALRFARYLAARDKGLRVFSKLGFNPVVGDLWSEKPEVVLFSGGVNRMAIEPTLQEFEQREGVTVSRVYNGCGILVSQMRAGQRPDAYFACDISFMTSVGDLFLDSVDISRTDIVMLVQKGNPLGLRTLSDLAKPGLRLGVANEKQSALGALTARLLTVENLYETVMRNVQVQTPTADLLVNQIRTGSLDVVVVYVANTSQVREHLDLVSIDVPAAIAVQPYAVSRNSGNRYLMERLLAALTSAKSKAQFESVGFQWQAGPVEQ